MRPSRSTSGAAVWTVRWSVVTYTAAIRSLVSISRCAASFGLLDTVGRERWIAVPADEREQFALDMRRRLAVTDQQDLGGPGWWGESRLGKLPGLAHVANLPVQRAPLPVCVTLSLDRPNEFATQTRNATLGNVKGLNSRPIDTVDLLSLPVFVGTMVWESRVLARRDLREFGDLDDATAEELSDSATPAGPAGTGRLRAS